MADIHGKLVSVTEQNVGDAFAATAASSATTLTLYDVSDFDEDGGHVSIAGVVYAYDSVDMDLDTIHLTTGLTASAAIDDTVLLWDNDQGTVVSERIAMVTMDGQGDGDPLTADIDHSLSALLDRTTWAVGQSVTVAQDGESYRLTGVHGKKNLGQQKSASDGLYYGINAPNGTIYGMYVSNSGTPVRLQTAVDVRVKSPDNSTYMPLYASNLAVPSDAAVKTGEAAAPDALEIIAAAPAMSWRYKTDESDVQRVGPMANDLPDWMAQVDPDDGHLMVDTVRLIGVLWTAVGQLEARVAALEGT